VKVFTAAGSRSQPLQCFFKSTVLIGLIEPRVEHREADVTERKDANDKKEGSAPTEKPTDSRQQKYLPLNS
jgi:hypothetical protein